MRLSRIRLAGFKSFVDPTTFQLPSNLVGIVGPNGCGKSNVIDAVRWVMGEMSAKHLRGDSMADVIFNGSASRKPVGSASIELFFDNADGSIGGQYAQYAEISLRRTLSRDGTSSYFLNNTRCRRKDITDLFLGTGLGSRSYAIIEQGMVSRLVDAKPDEMRTYVEEAAGISKYKERRRETESRIQHTRDNLARLNDLRDEITKQIEYLQRQAKAAERYKEFKTRERRLEAELLAMRLAELDQGLDEGRLDLAKRETELEAAIADQRRLEAQIVAARERHVAATEAFNVVQAKHYAVQSEISRLEQEIAHRRQIAERQQADLSEARAQLNAIAGEISREGLQREELDASLAVLEPALLDARRAEQAAAESLRKAEDALEQWQDKWHEFNLGVKELQQASQVERTKAEHLEAQLSQLGRQRNSLEHDRGQIRLDDLERRLETQGSSERETQDRVEALQDRLAEIDAEMESLRVSERQLGADLEEATVALASARGQLGALQAMQQLALGAEDTVLGEWLKRENLGQQPRLAQQLRVEDRWVLAVETVLGDFLHAVCVKGFAHHLSALPDTQVTLVEHGKGSVAARPESLLAHVAEPGHSAALLADVLVAETLADAVKLQSGLRPSQSVVTPDGIWLGAGWVRINRGQRSTAGLLSREVQIRELKIADEVQQRAVAEIENRRADVRRRLAELGDNRTEAIQSFNAANRDHAEAIAVLENLREETVRARERQQQVESNLAQVTEECERISVALAEARSQSEAAERELESLAGTRSDLQRQQEYLLSAYNNARDDSDRQRASVGGLNIDFESKRVARDSVFSGLARLAAQQQQLADRAAQLEQEISTAEPALAGLQSELSIQLERQLEVDRMLTTRREDVESVESGLRSNEGQRLSLDKAATAAREAVEHSRMQVREAEVRRESVMENFTATGADLEVVMQEMPVEAETGSWQNALEEVRRKVDRLGPINLAAIEQFNEQSERKKYLDAQNDDLTAALDTLEQAIRKIDRESRSRFQETFDNINQGLKRIFPRLFGGGHAYLSLEGDDILSAGVTVMARPPGKRNSHIHLLSGGEKALTAVALIFSIFELNPAPFCLLDEVDAPLDEANVSRFCDIVREMAQRVQFVVITHNKTTMEMTKQLTGVTMNEPGVSRLVSVDLDTAVQLAAS